MFAGQGLRVLQYSSYADWYALRLTGRQGQTLTSESQTKCLWQRPAEWLAHLLTQRGLPGDRICQLLGRERHYLAGSLVLWALLCDGHWTPKDVDIFALTTWTGNDCRRLLRQDRGHYTAFLHDAFEFKRPFYTDEEYKALQAKAKADNVPNPVDALDRFEEKLNLLEEVDGYELFGLISRKFAPMVTSDEPRSGYLERQLARCGHHSIDSRKEGEFDYVLVPAGMGPETFSWFHPLTPAVINLVLEYNGLAGGYTSIPAFFAATADMSIGLALFGGPTRRLMVKDWDCLWTRSCRIQVDRIAPHLHWTMDDRRRLWIRTLARTDKYRDRGFTIDWEGDTAPLFTVEYPRFVLRGHRHRDDWVLVQPKLETNFLHHGDGLLSQPSNWARPPLSSWRPTARLRREAEQREADLKKASSSSSNKPANNEEKRPVVTGFTRRRGGHKKPLARTTSMDSGSHRQLRYADWDFYRSKLEDEVD